MVEAYFVALVECKCKAAEGTWGIVDLEGKMARSVHMGTLFASVESYNIQSLDISRNQLGARNRAAGSPQLFTPLKNNTTITSLKCAMQPLNDAGVVTFLLYFGLPGMPFLLCHSRIEPLGPRPNREW